ncbi:MAG: DUF4169 family protein, partial [Myxococcota bacterium]
MRLAQGLREASRGPWQACVEIVLSKVVNLGRERKRRARAAARRKADANAVAHGRTKADKRAAR